MLIQTESNEGPNPDIEMVTATITRKMS